MKKKTLNSIATKKDLDKLGRSLSQEIKGNRMEISKLWVETSGIRQELKQSIGELRNLMIEFKDEILGEVKAMREEFTAHQGAHERQQETFESHEKRIKKIEETAPPSSM